MYVLATSASLEAIRKARERARARERERERASETESIFRFSLQGMAYGCGVRMRVYVSVRQSR